MRRLMKISEARGKLPEVARHLAKNPGEVVLVEHRDLDARIAMISEAHLRYLESTVTELRKRIRKPFQLAGSVTSRLGDEELESELQRMRVEQANSRERKLREIAS